MATKTRLVHVGPVDEALMIEPIETESPRTPEVLAQTFERIAADSGEEAHRASHHAGEPV